MEQFMTAPSIKTLHPTETDDANRTLVLGSTTMSAVLWIGWLIKLLAAAPDTTCWS
jgi:hypothetical protein